MRLLVVVLVLALLGCKGATWGPAPKYGTKPVEDIAAPAAVRVGELARYLCTRNDGVRRCAEKVEREAIRRSCRCGVESDDPLPTRCRVCSGVAGAP